jgi:hypothetical protein
VTREYIYPEMFTYCKVCKSDGEIHDKRVPSSSEMFTYCKVLNRDGEIHDKRVPSSSEMFTYCKVLKRDGDKRVPSSSIQRCVHIVTNNR